MKKLILSSLVMSLALMSCQDKDAPTITLNGESEMEVSLNQPFTDPGAMAEDEQDGDISAAVTVDGEVNVDLVGSYELYYNVSDEAGNAAPTESRVVNVINDADFLSGAYYVSGNMMYATSTGTSTAVSENDDINVSTTINNRFFLDNYSIYGDLDGEDMDFPSQGPAGDEWSGTGAIQSNGILEISLDRANNGNAVEYDLEYVKSE